MPCTCWGYKSGAGHPLNMRTREGDMPRDTWRNLPRGPQRTFFGLVNDLWRSQGMPSGRAIAKGISKRGARVMISQGTVNNLLDGPRIPLWDNAAEVIRYLGGHPQDYLPYYNQARRAAAVPPPDPRDGGDMAGIDMTGAGSELELRSLLRSRGYAGHETLLGQSKDDGEWQPAGIEYVLKFVDAAISRLDDGDRKVVASCLFGIDAGWREMSLVERREQAAELLHRSPRTIYRMQDALITDVAAAMTTMLRTMSPGELSEVISKQDILTPAKAESLSERLRAKLAAQRQDPARASPD
jgi:hypothetical protein